MSKVYEYHMEMNELCNDADYQDYLAEIEHKAQEDAYGHNDVEENKAKEFARKLGEVA